MSRVPFGAAISGIGVRVYGLAAATPCEGSASEEPFGTPPGVRWVCKEERRYELRREVMHRPESAIAALREPSWTGPAVPAQRGNRHQDRRAAPNCDENAASQRSDHERLAVASADSEHQRSVGLGFEQLGGGVFQQADA